MVDKCLGELLETVDQMGGRWLVASDHGNADDMVQVRPPPFKPLMISCGAIGIEKRGEAIF